MATQYTIRKGDTLSGIAKKYGTTTKALMELNPNISNADRIYAGGSLSVSAPSKPAPATPSTPKASTPSAKPASQPSTRSTTSAPANPNAPTGLVDFTGTTDAQKRERSEGAINPVYNAEIEAFTQATDRNKLALENQIGSLQNLYDLQKDEAQEYYTDERQRASDDSLRRGLARSSYAVNTQERVSDQEGKHLERLQQNLSTEVNNINTQITQLEGQLADSLKRLDIDRATKIQAEIERLTQEEQDKQIQITQINNQFKQYEEGFAYQQQRDSTADSKQQEQFTYQKERDSIADAQRQEEFDWKKAMDQASLDLQRKNAARS